MQRTNVGQRYHRCPGMSTRSEPRLGMPERCRRIHRSVNCEWPLPFSFYCGSRAWDRENVYAEDVKIRQGLQEPPETDEISRNPQMSNSARSGLAARSEEQ